MAENPYAQMTDKELEAAKNELVAKIKANETRIAFVASKMGKLFLAEKGTDLAETRLRYGKLVTNGPAEEIVRGLVRIQERERLLGKECEMYEKLDNEKKVLDFSMKLCHNVYRALEKNESSGR